MFANAIAPSEGVTFIGEGQHNSLALCNIAYLTDKNKYKADFFVLDSSCHKPGEIVSTYFNPYANHFPNAGQTELGRLMQLLDCLFNAELGAEKAEANLLELLRPEQPGRGMVVSATGKAIPPKANADGTPKLDSKGQPKKPFTKVMFYPVPEAADPAVVLQVRAQIEASAGFQMAAKAAPAPVQAQPQAQPAATPVAQPPAAPVAPAVPVATVGIPGLNIPGLGG